MTYDRIDPACFIHPEDRQALAALRKVPGLDALLRGLQGATVEEAMFAMIGQTSIRCGPTQFRSLYRLVEDSCRALDVPVPDVYLSSRIDVNAWAFGYTRYAITLHEGLVDRFEEDAIRTVVAHEVGHILCDHMLYRSTAIVIAELGAAALTRLLGPVGAFAITGIELALYRWARAAEYSCDRASVLVTGDPQLCARTLASLGGFSTRYREEFDLEVALQQAERVRETTSAVGKALDLLRVLYRTHPDPIPRALAVLEWARSREYAEISGGNYSRRS